MLSAVESFADGDQMAFVDGYREVTSRFHDEGEQIVFTSSSKRLYIVGDQEMQTSPNNFQLHTFPQVLHPYWCLMTIMGR